MFEDIQIERLGFSAAPLMLVGSLSPPLCLRAPSLWTSGDLLLRVTPACPVHGANPVQSRHI